MTRLGNHATCNKVKIPEHTASDRNDTAPAAGQTGTIAGTTG